MPERVIASMLNREGLKSDSGSLWSRSSIHQILTNEKYIGNNVYNRTSFKLKIKHQKNTPDNWVRKDNAFQPIVPMVQFLKVQEIIASRSNHLDDEQMLRLLKQTLEKHGALSGLVIDEDDAVPSSSAYRTRFGSLLRAYSLVGFTPKRDYAYLEINKELRRQHPQLIAQMTNSIESSNGWVTCDPETDLLPVNDEFTVSLVIARCKPTPSGTFRWRIRFDASLQPDITVVARMGPEHANAFDYYVLPAIDYSANSLPTLEDNGFTLDAYRTDSLDSFLRLAGRVPLQEAA